MAGEFSGHEFAVGELIGIRAFQLRKDGWLTSPLIGMKFQPGVNVARCLNEEPLLGALHGWMGSFPRSLYGAKLPRHRVGDKYCSCGFYAYYDGPEDNMYAVGVGKVRAIVKGHGLCTYGSRGFRAEKCELVGLVRQSTRIGSPGRLVKLYVWAALILCTFTTVTTAVRGEWISAGFNGALALLNLWTLRGNPLPTTSTLTWRKVRRNYPGVPIYRSVAAALEAHPLTVPEMSEAAS